MLGTRALITKTASSLKNINRIITKSQVLLCGFFAVVTDILSIPRGNLDGISCESCTIHFGQLLMGHYLVGLSLFGRK